MILNPATIVDTTSDLFVLVQTHGHFDATQQLYMENKTVYFKMHLKKIKFFEIFHINVASSWEGQGA